MSSQWPLTRYREAEHSFIAMSSLGNFERRGSSRRPSVRSFPRSPRRAPTTATTQNYPCLDPPLPGRACRPARGSGDQTSRQSRGHWTTCGASTRVRRTCDDQVPHGVAHQRTLALAPQSTCRRPRTAGSRVDAQSSELPDVGRTLSFIPRKTSAGTGSGLNQVPRSAL